MSLIDREGHAEIDFGEKLPPAARGGAQIIGAVLGENGEPVPGVFTIETDKPAAEFTTGVPSFIGGTALQARRGPDMSLGLPIQLEKPHVNNDRIC